MRKVINKQKYIPQEVIDMIDISHVGRFSQDIKSWREALEQAEMMQDRSWLYNFYRDVVEDDQVTATISQRKNGILLADFNLVDKTNDINIEATNYFKGAWFQKVLNIMLDSIYYGFSLTNLATNERVPFINLFPEAHAIRKKAFSGNNPENLVHYIGTDYEGSLLESYMSIKDLGLLNKVAPFYIWKKAFGSWAELGARFGMPYRTVKTDLTDIDKVRNAKNMLQNMMGAGWAILDEADEYSEIQRTSISNSSQLYDDLIQACDRAISKIIVGQTSTTEEKSFAGSAGVHKSILDDFIAMDKKYIATTINTALIPKLQMYNKIPLGVTFIFTTSDNLSFETKIKAISRLSPYYHIPEEFVKGWTGIDVEEKTLITPPAPAQQQFRELIAFSEIIPGTLDEKMLKGGIIKITARDKDNKPVNYAYSFPENWTEKKIDSWLKQRGLWQEQ